MSIVIAILTACNDGSSTAPKNSTQILRPREDIARDKTKGTGLDKSPMDMIYAPSDYPVNKMSGRASGLPLARVIYSRPFKDGRTIFGNVVKYGSYWRLGANESTEIEFFRDVRISGQRVKRGRYILYCIPFRDKWTFKLNGDLYTWGLKVHASGDLYSFDVPAITMERTFEVLTMEFVPMEKGTQLIVAWDNVRAALQIEEIK